MKSLMNKIVEYFTSYNQTLAKFSLDYFDTVPVDENMGLNRENDTSNVNNTWFERVYFFLFHCFFYFHFFSFFFTSHLHRLRFQKYLSSIRTNLTFEICKFHSRYRSLFVLFFFFFILLFLSIFIIFNRRNAPNTG